MNDGLRDRIAVVTGGGRGIGRAVALELACCGAIVAVVARTQPELRETVESIERARGAALAFPADIAVEHDVFQAMASIERTFGQIDILVNCAGRCWPIGPFADERMDEWWHTLVVNLRGPILASRAALPGMIARQSGRIINIASSARAFAFLSSYSTSKAALVRFSETLALEVRAHGITVFAVGPGTVRTTMAENSLASAEGRKWIPWFRRIFENGLDLPMERPVELIRELASGKADALSGRYITAFDNLDGLIASSALAKIYEIS